MTEAEAGLFERAAPHVPDTYAAIIAALGRVGPFAVEAKKTSIHLVAGSAFAGVHPQKSKLRLNIRTDRRLEGSRVRKVEQVSAHRFHNEIDLTTAAEVDDQLLAWLTEAYALAGKR
jgi:hypothetical protein